MYDYDRRRFAMEFGTEDALKKYLQAHPKADPKKHSVRGPKEEKDTPKKETSTATAKAKGKGGPGKQRVDWVNQLKKDHKPSSQEDEDAVRHLNTAAVQYDKYEKLFEDGPTEKLLKTLQTAFKAYNNKLKEAFGADAVEKEPTWELPKAKPKEPEPKAKEPVKREPEKPKAKEPEKKDEDRRAKHHKFPVDLEKKFEKEHGGKVEEVHFESNHSDSDEDDDEEEGLFTVITNKGLYKVVVEGSKIVEVHEEDDDEEDDDEEDDDEEDDDDDR